MLRVVRFLRVFKNKKRGDRQCYAKSWKPTYKKSWRLTYEKSWKPRFTNFADFFYWLGLAGIQATIMFAFCGTGCTPGQTWGTTIDIPVYLVVLLPWALRFRYTKQAIQGAFQEPIDEAWAAPVRKAILELGTKYTRLQINEIAEKVNVANEKQIVAVVRDMIERGQIAAEYFESSRSVAFDQQANTAALAKFIADLEGQFTEWGKDGKKT